MAIMMTMTWGGITPLQYDELRAEVGWLDDAPAGGRIHVAAFSDRGLQVTDVWESAEEFQSFVDDRLMPAVQQLGLAGEPEVQILPLHELYTPEPGTILNP
jgi:hypothetical protein